MSTQQDDPEDYFLPLVDQRVFGAGIKRKRIPFVPAANLETTSSTTTAQQPSHRPTGSRYLDIVLPHDRAASEPPSIPVRFSSLTPESPSTTEPQISIPASSNQSRSSPERSQTVSNPQDPESICPICNTPLKSPTPQTHATSLQHQLALPHVHPPSHLPRTHIGLRYLSSHGWDPDARVGLGRDGEGIREPIKNSGKMDRVGLRERGGDEEWGVDGRRRSGRDGGREEEDVLAVKKMDAKAVRRREAQDKKRTERLRQSLFGRVDVNEYLDPRMEGDLDSELKRPALKFGKPREKR